jgi:hypothetical protein
MISWAGDEHEEVKKVYKILVGKHEDTRRVTLKWMLNR